VPSHEILVVHSVIQKVFHITKFKKIVLVFRVPNLIV